MIHITFHQISDAAMYAVASSSVVFRYIPTPETYNDWPRFQGWYKLFYVTFKYIAFNKSNGGSK